ncbi:MAG TPA: dihydroneopterin aldolase [Gammaproteobacteria bacterium]|jgi:dihydroneopterin aldolase|nr:dihydroneopterin aldolase [Gammaproteobacteria bacterium]
MKTNLSIRQLELSVFLGWPEAERAQKQSVWIDIEWRPINVPGACVSDNLEETLCYFTLITQLKEKTEGTSFRLIEHLAQTIYKIVQTFSSLPAQIQVGVKKYPPIPGLTQGVYFTYGDH